MKSLTPDRQKVVANVFHESIRLLSRMASLKQPAAIKKYETRLAAVMNKISTHEERLELQRIQVRAGLMVAAREHILSLRSFHRWIKMVNTQAAGAIKALHMLEAKCNIKFGILPQQYPLAISGQATAGERPHK